MTMRMTVSSVRLFIEAAAEAVGDGVMADDEHHALRELIHNQLDFAHKLLMNIPIERPNWTASAPDA